MYRKTFFTGVLALVLLGVLPASSCSRKTGCPAYEDVHVKTDRRGNLPTKGGSSQLFSKDMRKRMNKKG